jgi:hypothetical protein
VTAFISHAVADHVAHKNQLVADRVVNYKYGRIIINVHMLIYLKKNSLPDVNTEEKVAPRCTGSMLFGLARLHFGLCIP